MSHHQHQYSYGDGDGAYDGAGNYGGSGYAFQSPNARASSADAHYPSTSHHQQHSQAPYSDADDYARYPTNEYDSYGAGGGGAAASGGRYGRKDEGYGSDLDDGAYAAVPPRRFAGDQHDAIGTPDSDEFPEKGAVGTGAYGAYGDAGGGGRGAYPLMSHQAGGGAAGMGPTYTGKSIWSREDKRAFQERSMVGKILGPIWCVVFFTVLIVICAICLLFIVSRSGRSF